MFDVTALGEVLIDFTEAGTSGNERRCSSATRAALPPTCWWRFSTWGIPPRSWARSAATCTAISVRGVLESEGIDCTGLISDPNFFTTLAFVALAPTGERTFSLRASRARTRRFPPTTLRAT